MARHCISPRRCGSVGSPPMKAPAMSVPPAMVLIQMLRPSTLGSWAQSQS